MSPPSAASAARPLSQLHRRWWALLLLNGLAVLAIAAFLYQQPGDLALPRSWAFQWALLAGGVLAGEMLFLRRNLVHNRSRPDEPLRAALGWGNGVTLARGVAYGFMAGFLFAPRPGGLWDWAPALLYTGASLADYLDGYLARVTGQTSRLGEILDMEFDGLGMLIAIGLAVQYGQLPVVFLLLGLARPLFVWGMAWRARRGLPHAPLPPSTWRRLVAGLLMGAMAVILWPILAPPATYLVGAIFGLPVAAGFLRDWLVVSGRLRAESPAYVRWRARLRAVLFDWAPLALRGAALPVTAWVLWSLSQAPVPPAVLVWAGVVGVAAALAAALGWAARLAGVLLIGLACLHLALLGQGPANWTLLAAAGLLVELGSGRASLWAPEVDWLQRRGGGREAPREPI